MVTFFLKNLGKNQEYFPLKRKFFPFGYHENFTYYSNTGDGKLIYKKIDDNDRDKLIQFFRDNNISYEEKIELTDVKTYKNLSFFYYKDKTYGKNIENFIWTDAYNTLFKIEDADDSVKLTTTYPGLLIGSGYNHPKLKDEKDYQLGFFFDHTTGLPLITGSSIKGVLRSLFEDENRFCYLKTIHNIEENREAMLKRLFEDGNTIFYDAYIIDTANEDRDGNSIIFGSDYITSHHSDDHMGQFREPNPVKFLKILPEVTWQFQFKAESDDIELFKKIILDFGLGAKTNVGYGQFRE